MKYILYTSYSINEKEMICALNSPAVTIPIQISGIKCNHSELLKNLVLILYIAEKNRCYFLAFNLKLLEIHYIAVSLNSLAKLLLLSQLI